MTEIGKLIERLKARAEATGSPYVRGAYIKAMQEAQESLPAERQAIEEAYSKGQIDASDAAEFETRLTKPTNYFNKTFKK